jgi:transcriptional regulator with XRE-family HTH domain
MPDMPRTFGDLVRAERMRAGMTATAAAAAVGVTKSFWSDIEHGRRWPAADVAERMRAALGVGAATWGLMLARERIGTELFDLVSKAAVVDERQRIRDAVRAAQDRFRERGNTSAAAGLSSVYTILDAT